jgi:hypothetical protein
MQDLDYCKSDNMEGSIKGFLQCYESDHFRRLPGSIA